MLNRWVALGVLLLASFPALAARRMTVEQLQQTLSAAQAAHQSDDAVLQQLGDARLTARLTGNRLKRVLDLSPGPKTTQALHAISDASAFLDPPPDELPGTLPPDFATQKAIIGRTIYYVVHTLPALPNFVATRATDQYVEDLRGVSTENSARGGLFLIGSNHAPISFREGRETDDPALAQNAGGGKKNHVRNAQSYAMPGVKGGLVSWGEFGPILGIVLLDAAKGKLSWERWQQEEGKSVAAFRFSVDRSISNYRLNYCCERGAGGIDTAISNDQETVLKPGYHGRFEVDPETGSVLRVAIEADLRSDDLIQQASIMVEYGPVTIGDSSYMCPTRSVAISVARAEYSSHGTLEGFDKFQLNETEFVDYHRFGSEATLVAELPPAGDAPANAAPAEAVLGPVAPGNAPTAVADPVAAPPVPAVAAPNLSSTATTAPAVAAAESDADKEILVRAVEGPPGFAGNSATKSGDATEKGSGGNFTLKVTTRSVEVGLVANDRHGKPVGDLKPEQIEIYDNGRRQQIRAFHHSEAAAPGGPEPAPAVQTDSSGTFTNAADATGETQDAPDLLILLMDESHLPFLDLNRARDEVMRFMKAIRPDSKVALYAIGEHGFYVIQDVTQDHALVIAKLAAWRPSASAISQAQSLEQRNKQQFDTVHSVDDLNSVNGNNVDAAMTMQTTDPELREMGDSPLRQALEGMVALARHFGSVPGHKSLAWISGDSALADWEDRAVGTEKGPKQLDAALAHTREALNEAHISLYAVNASNVEGGQIDASLENRNVELNPVTAGNPSAGGQGGNNGAGRITAQMQQDLHGIEGPVRKLAEGTGGRAINKGSDLAQTLDRIEQDERFLYELSFEPDTLADGKFHTILVKVPTRKDLVLRYRTGYLYAEEAESARQRFQQALWSPQDAAGIGLTAEPGQTAASGESTIKLRIRMQGLALEEKDGRWSDNLYIFVAQRDDGTQKTEISGDTLRLALKQGTYDSGMPAGIPYQREVAIKSKLGSVRVIVVDANSGKIGSVTLQASALHP